MREKDNGRTEYWHVLILRNGKEVGRDHHTIKENHEKNNFLCYFNIPCSTFTLVSYLPEYKRAPFHSLKFSGRLYKAF